jgi:4-hydroxythreonine-4-phosphate dehydrogenase
MSRLVVTQGDPDGIGPELVLHAAAEGMFENGDHIVAGAETLERLAAALPAFAARGLSVVAPLLAGPREMTQVEALEHALSCLNGDPSAALVTAPIDKARARAEGFVHAGHTEFLVARTGARTHAMTMVGPRLRVALVTTHLPLRAVADALDPARIVEVSLLLHDHLRAAGLDRPRIAVLGLNPHAGERGLLGSEDEAVIAPAIAEANRLRCGFEGPLPADTAFHRHHEGAYDGIVAMYHDQGLAPFKLVHFHDGVNLTLGLPFVRTSPDHGTARDIAGRGIADPRSFFAAIRLARSLARASTTSKP